MDVPRVRMQTEGKHSFSSQDGYDDVTPADLQELLRLGRETVVSLEDELARRNTSASNMFRTTRKWGIFVGGTEQIRYQVQSKPAPRNSKLHLPRAYPGLT
jgi:hypothetical protein